MKPEQYSAYLNKKSSETYKDRQGEPGIIIRKTNTNRSVKENIRGNIAKNDVLIDERNTKRS